MRARKVSIILTMSFLVFFAPYLKSDGPPSQKPMSSFPQSSIDNPPKDQQQIPITPLTRPQVPVMQKPFGMPGVVGIVNNAWQNSDYLGYLSHNIPVTVEILLGKGVPSVDPQAIEKAITTALQREDIISAPEVREGPIFPFIHFLVVVYPADEKHFVAFTSLRLFEQINVVRKRFSPAGYWQGITWENQDVNVTNASMLQTQVNSMAEKLATLFAARYHEYNKDIDKAPAEQSLTE